VSKLSKRFRYMAAALIVSGAILAAPAAAQANPTCEHANHNHWHNGFRWNYWYKGSHNDQYGAHYHTYDTEYYFPTMGWVNAGQYIAPCPKH